MLPQISEKYQLIFVNWKMTIYFGCQTQFIETPNEIPFWFTNYYAEHHQIFFPQNTDRYLSLHFVENLQVKITYSLFSEFCSWFQKKKKYSDLFLLLEGADSSMGTRKLLRDGHKCTEVGVKSGKCLSV